jgi:hypothetical protein
MSEPDPPGRTPDTTLAAAAAAAAIVAAPTWTCEECTEPGQHHESTSCKLCHTPRYTADALGFASKLLASKVTTTLTTASARFVDPDFDETDVAPKALSETTATPAPSGHAAARPLFERALAIREQALGPRHPDTAASLNELAVCLASQGEFVLARPLQERALAINLSLVGPQHHATASCLNSLINVLRDGGWPKQAHPLLEISKAIRKTQQLHASHPQPPAVWNALAHRLRDATPQMCGACNKMGAPNKCGGCQVVWYCNATCQKHDRKQHKANCVPPAGATAK